MSVTSAPELHHRNALDEMCQIKNTPRSNLAARCVGYGAARDSSTRNGSDCRDPFLDLAVHIFLELVEVGICQQAVERIDWQALRQRRSEVG